MRRIYDKLQTYGDGVYKHIGLEFKSSWFSVYYSLYNSKRALTVAEITEAISYSRITVKNVVRELEKVGFVIIIKNPVDSRSKLIYLTEKGKEIAPKLETIWVSFNNQLKSILGDNENNFLQQLSQINTRLTNTNLKKQVLIEYYDYQIRNAKKEEFVTIGKMLVEVYSNLNGFPKIDEQPEYYNTLRNIGNLTKNKNIELLVAVSKQNKIGGAVVYFNDMKDYGSGGTATQEKNACGFRLLGVPKENQGLGIGKLLTDFWM